MSIQADPGGAKMSDHDLSPECLREQVRTLRARLAHWERAEDGRRQAVEALRRSDALNRRVLEAVPGGVVLVGPDGAIRQANAEARRLLGLSWEELSARFVPDWEPETVREDGSPCPASDYPVTKCLRTGLPQPAATVGVRRPDGRLTWAIFTATPLPPDGDGRPAGAVVTFLDITERKRVEQALRESEQCHRAISELTSDYAWGGRVEPDGTVVLEWATEGFRQVTGYTVQEWEALGGSFHFVHPDDVPAARERTKDYLLAGRPNVAEVRVRARGGAWRRLHYSIVPIREGGRGRVVRVFGAVQDVTARRQAEESLRESNRRLTNVLESTTDAFFALDRDACFRYVNHRAAQLMQRTREELLGRQVWAMFPEAVGTAFQRQYEEAVASGHSVHYEEFYPPLGKWFEVHGYPSPDGVAIYFRDVTRRRQARETLDQQREILQTIFDRIPVLIAFFDAEGRLQLANREWERVLGWSLAEAQQRDIFAECYPDPQVCREALDFVRGDAPGWRDFPVRVRDGRVVDTSWAVVRLSDGTCITIGQDVTERKRAEGQLQDYAARLRALSCRLLEVQEQERRHLACELHDEVGQDVTGLKLTLEYAGRLEGEEQRAQLAGAQRLLKNLAGRVRDLSLRLRPTMLDDLGLRPALLWHFERYTAQTQVRVVFEHGPLPDRFEPAVETAAYRIVQEALTNVARHAGAREAAVRLWADDDVLGVQVADEGAGFEADGKPGAGPSGGLSGMQERARLLGGHLEIESSPGAGTRLTALLPLRNTGEIDRHGPDPVACR